MVIQIDFKKTRRSMLYLFNCLLMKSNRHFARLFLEAPAAIENTFVSDIINPNYSRFKDNSLS